MQSKKFEKKQLSSHSKEQMLLVMPWIRGNCPLLITHVCIFISILHMINKTTCWAIRNLFLTPIKANQAIENLERPPKHWPKANLLVQKITFSQLGRKMKKLINYSVTNAEYGNPEFSQSFSRWSCATFMSGWFSTPDLHETWGLKSRSFTLNIGLNVTNLRCHHKQFN